MYFNARIVCFNSMIVRLKGENQDAMFLTGGEFQFYDSPIKSK